MYSAHIARRREAITTVIGSTDAGNVSISGQDQSESGHGGVMGDAADGADVGKRRVPAQVIRRRQALPEAH
jgi:hypothetical protein